MQEQNEAAPRSLAEPDPEAARSGSDLAAGPMFGALGLAALVIGRSYPVGSSLDAGPGHFVACLDGYEMHLQATEAPADLSRFSQRKPAGLKAEDHRWKGREPLSPALETTT